MSTYAKLFSSIVHSTIWREANHVRLVWITMLALKDQNGIVEASVPGLADVARVTLSEVDEAIEKLSSPDKYSRTKAFEGRRIEEVPGGWRVLNHDLYRDRESEEQRRIADAERARQYRLRRSQETREGPNGEHEEVRKDCASRDESEIVTEKRDDDPQKRDASRSVTLRHAPSRSVTLSDTDQIQIKSEREDLKIPLSPPGGGRRKAREKSPESICPDEFVPTEATLAVAKELRVDWSKHFARMRDWSRGNGRRKADWQATLRNWMRNNPREYQLQEASQSQAATRSIDASTLGVTL